MSRLLAVPAMQPAADAAAVRALKARVQQLEAERESLLDMMTHLQRVAQTGLVTSGLVHDVNNHTQGIAGTAFLAQRSKSPEAWHEALGKIQRQCMALAETAETFLGFVRRQDRVGKGTFDLCDVLAQVQRLAAPLAGPKSLDLQVVIPAAGEYVVEGSSRLAVQAVVNLVSNAVRAAENTGGTVAVSACALGPVKCRLEVVDNGPGIPDDLRRRLFRPFATGNAGNGGTGLGLFIVRQAVRRLGGAIRVLSTEDGTAVQLDLPTRERNDG